MINERDWNVVLNLSKEEKKQANKLIDNFRYKCNMSYSDSFCCAINMFITSIDLRSISLNLSCEELNKKIRDGICGQVTPLRGELYD